VESTDGKRAPDLVIHVGDYRYRYRGDNSGDNWENWQKDFFVPGQGLLRAAPWIMARGNHESCFNEQGPGWFYFLQPEYQHVTDCPENDRVPDPENLPPYAVDLAWPLSEGNVNGLSLVVLDSTDAKYRCQKWAEDFELRHIADLERFMHQVDSRDNWIVTHYPIWDVSAHTIPTDGIAEQDKELHRYLHCEGEYYNADSVHRYRRLLASAIEKKAGVVLSGDTHHFQVVRVHDSVQAHDSDEGRPARKSDHPLQIVAGHGGTLMTPGLGASGPNPDNLFEDTCERATPIRYFQRALPEFPHAKPRYWVLGKSVCKYGSVVALHDDHDGWTFALDTIEEDAMPPVATVCPVQGSDSGLPCYHDKVTVDNCVKLGGGSRKCLVEGFTASSAGE
jgi:hypothetical protein